MVARTWFCLVSPSADDILRDAGMDLEAVARAFDQLHAGQLADRGVHEVEGLARRERKLHLAAMAVAQRGIVADESHAPHMRERVHGHVGERQQHADDQHGRGAVADDVPHEGEEQREGDEPREEDPAYEEERFHALQDSKALPAVRGGCDESPDRGGETRRRRRET